MKDPPHPSPAVTNFLATFEGFPLGAALIDANSGRVAEVNGAFAAIVRTNRETLPGMGLVELIEPAEASTHKLPWVSPEHRQATQFATRLRQADGILVAVRVTLTPLGLESPHHGHWLCQIETLADAGIPSRRMDTPLVQKMLDSIPAPLAFSTLDSDHRVTYLNRAFQQTFGYTLADIPTVEDWARQAYPDPRYRADSMSAWGEKVARAVATRRPVEPAEYRVTRKDGQARDVLIDANVLDDLLLCVFIDQTEEKARERRLRRSERRFRHLTEVMHDAAWVLDPFSQTLSYVSPSVRRIYGYTAEEMLSQPSDQTLVPEFRDAARDLCQQRLEDFLAGRQPENHFYRDELPHLTQSGERGWSEAISHFLRDPGTGRVELWGVTRDITERKRFKRTLSESEERFRQAFDTSNAGMCLVDLEGRLFRVNRRMCELFGYSQTELEQMTVDSLTCPEDQEISRAYIQAALAGKTENAIFEKRYRNREGQVIHALVSPAVVRDARGQPLYFITQLQDITEMKLAQAALQVSEEKFSQAFQSTLQLMSITRLADGAFMEINPAGAAMFGYTREELIGKTTIELGLWLEDSQRERFLTELKDSGNVSAPQEVGFRRRNGEIRTALVTANILDWKDGAVLLLTANDITERKQAEKRTQETLQLLRLAARAADIGIWNWDLASGRLDWDERLCAWYEVPEGAIQSDALPK